MTDVVVVGAGGDGPVLAWRLGDLGLDVLVLEAGPWHGNERWSDPHGDPGGTYSDDPDDLSGSLLDEQFTGQEAEMSSPLNGKFRWAPADSDRTPWPRTVPQNGIVWQLSGVGGTTLHYFGNHPRAYPEAIDGQGHWPIEYADLVPYYQFLEETYPIRPAPTTAKEELFYHGCREAGYELLTGKNVVRPGYRPIPNAIHQPDEKLAGDYDGDFHYPDIRGDTLAGHGHQGAPYPRDAPLNERARRSTNVSFVPKALETGRVTIRPNAFVTDVLTEGGPGSVEAIGVEFRDTWSGDRNRVYADTVVLAAGCVETPRLWLNSGLPNNGWIGRGLTTHWFDFLAGVFDADTLKSVIDEREVRPYVGQTGAARLDVPGTGAIEINAYPPGFTATSVYSISRAGYYFENDTSGEPWDTRGRVAGAKLKELMADYERTLTLQVYADDRPRRENGVRLDPAVKDEHGPVPMIEWQPSPEDDARRDELARVAAEVLRDAGADHVHRADMAPVLIHLQSSMAMGKVVDDSCEAFDVDRLFIADHSVLANGLGGPNPTHTGQAVALHTAEQLAERYFDVTVDSLG